MLAAVPMHILINGDVDPELYMVYIAIPTVGIIWCVGMCCFFQRYIKRRIDNKDKNLREIINDFNQKLFNRYGLCMKCGENGSWLELINETAA